VETSVEWAQQPELMRRLQAAQARAQARAAHQEE
jgi:hypothetical protein